MLDLRALTPGDIEIEDIAHCLAGTCRFMGGTPRHYSTAQHSVILVEMVPKNLALAALLHDGGESLCGDLPSFLKHAPELAGYREIESRVQAVVFEAFGVADDERIHMADRALGEIERRQFMFDELTPGIPPIVCWPAPWAKQQFLRLYRELVHSGQVS